MTVNEGVAYGPRKPGDFLGLWEKVADSHDSEKPWMFVDQGMALEFLEGHCR